MAVSDSEIRWTLHRARTPAKSVGLVAAYGVAALAGQLALNSPFGALAGGLLVAGATVEYWTGAVYRLRPQNASRRVGLSLTSMAWEEVKTMRMTADEVWLTPLTDTTGRLASLRGVRIHPLPENRAAVIAYIHEHLPESISRGGDGT